MNAPRRGGGWPGAATHISRTLTRFFVFFAALHFLLFVLFDLLPDAAAVQAGWTGADPRILAQTRERLGLVGTWRQRYARQVMNLIRGELGHTLVGNFPVDQVLRARVRASLPILTGALILTLALPIPFALAATSGRGYLHRLLRRSPALGLVPAFFACSALHLLWVLTLSLRLPLSWESSARLTLAALGAGLLPASVVAAAATNTLATLLRQPFVTVYAAKGMSPLQIRLKLCRNVLADLRPLASRCALLSLTGCIFAELSFGIPGVGALLVESLRASDTTCSLRKNKRSSETRLAGRLRK